MKFDTDYDSRINMPDFGLFASDYGYSNDANLPGSHDPNCERSDFNGDHAVDIEDLEMVSNYWLTKVFDEYRICGLCNLYRNPDPNEPEIDNIIDSRDYDAFMAEWGKQSYSGCSVLFENGTGQPIEPNSLSDEITIFPEGFPPYTMSIFAQIDGQFVGLSYPGFEKPSVAVPTDEYGNGWHTLTIGGYTMDGGCWLENVKVRFWNSLFFSTLQKVYEPNEPILFAAYNTDAGDATVAVYGDGGQLVWSQDFTGNTIWGSIPADIASNHLIDYVNFSSSGGASVNKATVPEVSSDNVDPKIQALMIMPDTRLFELDPHVRTKIIQAFTSRNIKYLRLEGVEANWENVAQYARHGFIKYIYFGGHGNYCYGEGADTILRTRTKFFAGRWVVSSKHSEYDSPPAWCKPLPEPLESTVRTWASMKFDRVELFYNDGCYSGRLKIDGGGNLIEGQRGQIGLFDGPHSDMTLALNMQDTFRSRCYHGWWDTGWVGFSVPKNWHSSYQKWGQDVWFRLGEGGNVDEALNYAIQETEYHDPNSAVQNYRIKGQGSLQSIRLNNRP